MANYNKYTDQELLGILGKYNSLTFIAKTELKKELVKRNIFKDTKDFKQLEQLINQEIEEIKTLRFLSDIGFKISWFNKGQSFEVTRSAKATLIDLVSIFLGIIFSVMGIVGLSSIMSYMSSDVTFTIAGFIFNAVLLSIGFFGFRILYNGTDRLIKYKDFKFIVNQGDMILRKRFDFKIEEIEKEISSLSIKKDGNQISLMSEDIEIINVTSPSYRAKMTLEEIISRTR
ncbi:hypothetical protein [Aquimarina spinulae]|uniref:hypothetical protein n=1 Tax=Aquimarina spinulae TaxID=1192023 RepID=UPI000D54BB7E|nr:hypothetical protein [Aquimarina spinulae]